MKQSEKRCKLFYGEIYTLQILYITLRSSVKEKYYLFSLSNNFFIIKSYSRWFGGGGANTIQHSKPVPKNEKHKKKMRTARMKQLWEWRENNRKNWEGNKKPKKRTGVSFIRKVKREIKYCCAIKINSLCTHIKY